jgi:hypothetical protein
MKIGILGAGNIGGTLGKKWAKAGHTLQFGVRDSQKAEVQALVKSLGAKASASSLAAAIDFAEVIVFAIPGPVMDQTIVAHAKALDGKIVIDTANKIGATPGHSLGTFARETPRASAYRAFNIYGWENFENPEFGGVPADLFFCGPDGQPRATVEALISAVGLRPIYVGGPEQAGLVDELLRLWFALAIQQRKGRHTTFKVLTR